VLSGGTSAEQAAEALHGRASPTRARRDDGAGPPKPVAVAEDLAGLVLAAGD
jgi:hypothetical protein